MSTRPLFFLDFDGVICDSVLECYVSSWIAYHTLQCGVLPDRVGVEELREFRILRPFIRRGGDYVLLQELVSQRIAVETQTEFDQRLDTLGVEKADANHAAFYTAREKLLHDDKAYWLRLNVLYPGIEDGIRRVADREEYFILSTKQAPFISEILEAHRISWPMRRIIDSGKRGKGDVIQEILSRHGCRSACFIDDQVDHLLACGAPEIRTFLAEWGYVPPSGVTDAVTTMTLDEFVGLLLDEEIERCE